MKAVRISLADGQEIFVDAPPADVRKLMERDGLVRVGTKIINPMQVTMLSIGPVPSVMTPEFLHDRLVR